MISKEYLDKCLALATDTKVFEMGSDILDRVPEVFSQQFPGKGAIVIADKNTWKVAGETVADALTKAGIQTDTFIIPKDKFHAEWEFVEMVESEIKSSGKIAVAVGSGVINDLCKLASHHLKQSYVCVPTAASVDGYSSFGASITFEGLKQTFECPAPVAIVADAKVIANAPKWMTAAGYADLAAKIPCGAEWMIADLFGTEPIIPDAWHVLQDVINDILGKPEAVAAGDPEAVGDLFAGLILSGIAMQIARSSRPASCTDHLFSHYLDMTGHRFKGELQSHGFQVAVGTLTMCAFFDEFLKFDLTKIDVDACVNAWPSLEEEVDRAHEIFKHFVNTELGANEIRKKYADKEGVRRQLTLVKENWPALKEKYRAQVWPFEKMRKAFATVGAPVEPMDIGITRDQLLAIVPFTQLMRYRINLLDLSKRARIYDELVAAVFTNGGAWDILNQ